MVGDQAAWAPPLVEMSGGIVGHLLAWERHERDGSWWAWVSWVHESGGRHVPKVVQVRGDSLSPLEPPDAAKQVPRRVLGHDGQMRHGLNVPSGPAVVSHLVLRASRGALRAVTACRSAWSRQPHRPRTCSGS